MSKLAQRLQMKPGTRWVILDAPATYAAALDAPDNAEINISLHDAFDGIQLFAKNSGDIRSALKMIVPVLNPGTIFWIMYPKKNSSIPTDLLMTRNWDDMAKIGWRPVQSAAVDDTWTALRFRPESLVKKSDTNNESLKDNQYSVYIDPVKKQVIMPPVISESLTPATIQAFEKLAYSHKKEYVLWVLTAKQEQTRLNRIEKMGQMLLAGKKNPADK